MRRFVAILIFCLLASGLSAAGFVQGGTASQKEGPGPAAEAPLTLEKTEWSLIRLGRTAVKGTDLRRPPEIALDPVSHRASGSGGCNRVMGDYELKGDALTFARMASTMMACPDGMETEQKFLRALEQVRRWKITGRQLELRNGSGTVVLVFQAAASGAN
jgi:heat shock protein HslJ